MKKSTLLIASVIGLGVYLYYRNNQKNKEPNSSTIKKIGDNSIEEIADSNLYQNGMYLSNPTMMKMY